MDARVRLGTQGWSHPGWVGVFYPPGSKQEHYLPFYSAIFDTVELDVTFDHPPKRSIVASWARHTPSHFRFAAKVPRSITHGARLERMGDQIQGFARALDPLGPRLGPLLVQMPPDFARDPGTVGLLDRFLAAAPAEVRIAVEFRHRSWDDPRTRDLLRARRASLAWTDWRGLPRATAVTTDFLYLRWLGGRPRDGRGDPEPIDRTVDLEAWERDLRAALPGVSEVYGYFDDRWAGHSPASANQMKQRLGLPTVEPKELWVQRELW